MSKRNYALFQSAQDHEEEGGAPSKVSPKELVRVLMVKISKEPFVETKKHRKTGGTSEALYCNY
jgi:hypothetical protein